MWKTGDICSAITKGIEKQESILELLPPTNRFISPKGMASDCAVVINKRLFEFKASTEIDKCKFAIHALTAKYFNVEIVNLSI